MNRAACARETLEILERGNYTRADGVVVDVRAAQAAAVAGTVGHRPESLPPVPAISGGAHITVTRATTMEALARLSAVPGGRLGCLNFASAKNPGGGFLGGAQAQEEALARSSGLYPCLFTQQAIYDENRAHRSLLYLDRAIYSPGVPFFRDDAGNLLAAPYFADVITCAAPNAGAVASNQPADLPQVAPTLARRAEFVLRVAAHHGVKRLVLGAWGCGVFRNDPRQVARVFADLLAAGQPWHGAFDEVIFAVFDASKNAGTYLAFAEMFLSDPP
ncbi:MAG TPA: TIGR02452 family protein [Lacunisphaera sp.]|nr:TIGR02452 family protein [Lacunisphaera sp.]